MKTNSNPDSINISVEELTNLQINTERIRQLLVRCREYIQKNGFGGNAGELINELNELLDD